MLVNIMFTVIIKDEIAKKKHTNNNLNNTVILMVLSDIKDLLKNDVHKQFFGIKSH